MRKFRLADSHPGAPAESKSGGWNPKQWVSIVPYGVHQQHPNAYRDILHAIWENRGQPGYAWRILRDGCCDGCALGTSSLYDWTMKGVHLCNIRLQLLRLNRGPAMDYRLPEDVALLQNQSEKRLRKLGRLSVPMVRRKGEKGLCRVSWDDAISLVAGKLSVTNPKHLTWYVTSRGLTNEAYYAHQKVARFIGTNHVDTSARICHAPSTAALNDTVGCAATTCSYSDWVGADLLVLVGTNLESSPVAWRGTGPRSTSLFPRDGWTRAVLPTTTLRLRSCDRSAHLCRPSGVHRRAVAATVEDSKIPRIGLPAV